MSHTSVWKRMYRSRVIYLFLLPAVIFVLIFCYVPMVGLILAFQDYDFKGGFLNSPFVGLANFREFLSDSEFYVALKNTLGINLLSIVFGFPLPIAVAILIFSMKDSLFKRVTQTISYLPHFISWVVVAGMVYRMTDVDSGVVNILITKLGSEPIAFMRDPDMFWGIIVSVAIWKELGWNTIIYLAALTSIDAEQYEAAKVDGATGFQRLIYITLPGISTVIALMLILTIGTLVSSNGNVSFDAVYNLRNALVSSSSDTLDYFVYIKGVTNAEYGLSTAIGLVQGLIALTLVITSNSISKKIRGYGAF